MGVRATLGSPATARPGEVSRSDVTVENTGAGIEHVALALTGEQATWGWFTPPALTLGPGEQGVAHLTFKAPRASHPSAGPLALPIALTAGGTTSEVQLTVEVAPFVDIFATLDPPTVRGRRARPQTLTVENRGNVAVSAALTGEGEDVAVQVEPGRIEVAPGRSTTARVAATTGRQSLRGSTTTRTFEVVVQPDGGGPPLRTEGGLEIAPAGWMGRVAFALLALAVGAVGLGALFSASGDDPNRSDTSPVTFAAPNPECPARDHLSPDANGTRRPGVQPSFDYSFLFVTNDGCHAVRFNPCAPVQYAVNRGLASNADVADLIEAVAKASAATGLEFQRVADTAEDPRRVPRPRLQPDGTQTWGPIVIGWARLGSGDGLRARDDDRADPNVVVGGGGRPEVVNDVIVTGNLILNLDAVTDTDTRTPVPHGFGPGVNWGRIILHELGHVIGLGHVESRTSIMNESLTLQTISSADWGGGDLIGLRQLGRDGGCVPVPPVPSQGAPR